MLCWPAAGIGAGAGNPARPAIFDGLFAAQRDAASAAHRKACSRAGHSECQSLVVQIQRADRGQRGADLRQHRYRLGRRAGPAHAVGAHQGNAAGSARHFGAEFAAVSAQYPRSEHQDHQGFQGQRPHRGARRAHIGAGADAANGGGQGLRREGLREARPAHDIDDTAGRHHRLAQGRRADHRRVQRAAVPVSAAGRRGRAHRAQFIRRDGRLAHLHRDLDLGQIPRFKPGAVQGLHRRAQGSDGDRRQGSARGRGALDRGF